MTQNWTGTVKSQNFLLDSDNFELIHSNLSAFNMFQTKLNSLQQFGIGEEILADFLNMKLINNSHLPAFISCTSTETIFISYHIKNYIYTYWQT